MTKESKLEKKNVDGKNQAISIISIVISVLVALGSLTWGWYESSELTRRQQEFELSLNERQEQFEMEQRYFDSIPYLRVSHSEDIYDTLEIFSVQDTEGIIDTSSSEYAFNTIINFKFENIKDNIVYFSHIEYGGAAHELVNLNLAVQKGEVISFSHENRFISTALDTSLLIVVHTSYNQYFSYKCSLNYGDRDGDTRTYTVEAIGEPEPYNIDNELYKYMIEHKHPRDLVILPEGDIIF